ncbi:alpha/beta fold hydrolase [Methylomagnum sp.]
MKSPHPNPLPVGEGASGRFHGSATYRAELEAPSEWLFLRGLVRESAHWDDFPERFAVGIPGARVVTLDLPGNGRHWRLNSPPSIPAMLEFARREAMPAVFPASPSSPPPRFLLAVSLGAMVAVEWLHRYPEEIAGAVLINTSLRGLSPIHQRLAWRSWPGLLRMAFQRAAWVRERAILALTSRHGAEDAARVEARARAYLEHPIRRSNLVRQLRAAATYHPPSGRPWAPVLLLSGRGDRLVDPACSEALARHWDAPLISHPWAGHDLPLDDPDWVIARVADFLWERASARE